MDDYVILVEEKNKSNNEKEKSNSLHSLENSTEEKNKRIKLHNKTPETVTTLSNSDESNLIGYLIYLIDKLFSFIQYFYVYRSQCIKFLKQMQ